jgi:FtsP/CotA-like multicopper oxidase with cupredoxin domain
MKIITTMMGGWRAGLMMALLAVFSHTQAQAPTKAKTSGMRMPARQSSPRAAATSPGKVRTYYIAADEVMWNYLPTPATFLLRGENELAQIPRAKSSIYLKSVYREYTSDSFTTLKPRAPEWEHLGILGPVIRAEVGDTIHVVFKNNSRFICSMHVHGLLYDKESEGAYYSEAAKAPPDASRKGNEVHKGEVFTYTWTVPERSGPGPGDPSSILWMYHSHFNESRDMNSGLFGPVIISRKGTTKPDGTPKDVDREFVVAFATFEENTSGYFMNNIVHDQQYPVATIKDPNFLKTLEYYSMNGYTNGTMPLLTMKKGERVRWYLMANSNEDDVHAPHWHGQTVLFSGMRTDTLNMGPMGMIVADMVPDNPGTWLFHCHVNDHLDGGMYSLFKVTP